MLFELFEKIFKKKTVRKFSDRLEDQRVDEAGYSPKVFEPDKSYFQIRLAEMFLRESTVYGMGYVPLCVLLSDFLYAEPGKETKRQTFPFYAGNQILKGLEQYVGKAYVELFDTKVVGPIPYIGADVGLFVGLFRSQVSNLAASLFKFAENIVSAFDVTKLSTFLEIARPLSAGLADILGLDEVDYILGQRNDFYDKPNDVRQFREGYLVYINCPEDHSAIKNLRVKDGRLVTGPDKTSVTPFRDFDFCLLRIECLETRNDYRTFPFFKLWDEARGAIWEGKEPIAESKILELYKELALSPDLTQTHRYDLIRVFKANFEQEKEIYNQTVTPSPVSKAIRRGGTALSTRARIEKLGDIVERTGAPARVVKSLLALNTRWDKLKRREAHAPLTDETLNNQLRAIAFKSKSPDPLVLADSLIAASLASAQGQR
ncbi:MAG: hypothetical protein PHU44_15460 [Syntrophales bacterium]|nr:hypothetical protein [Syntrophales bacterium]MDD5641878.1 hypothetical protein [Syntrophales bacterium]